MKYAVEPAVEGGFVPPHPLEGEMPAGGANWIADQHTLCLLRDGVLKRTPPPRPPEISAEEARAILASGEPISEGLAIDLIAIADAKPAEAAPEPAAEPAKPAAPPTKPDPAPVARNSKGA